MGTKFIKMIVVSSNNSKKVEISPDMTSTKTPLPRHIISKKHNEDHKKFIIHSKLTSKSETAISINDDTIRKNIRHLLNECNPEFAKLWDEKGPSVLLELKMNSNNETIIHYVCQHLNVELANVLLKYRAFSNLLKSGDNTPLEEHEFKKFVFAESIHGENALYQCLRGLDRRNKNVKLNAILRLYIDMILIRDPNDYINKRIGYKTTFLHLLIEREQLELLKYFIDCFEYGDDVYDPIDFMKKDYLEKTPLMTALEAGNKSLMKLIYDKVKAHLKVEDMKRLKEYVHCINDTKKDMFRNVLLQNKLVITSKDIRGSVNCMQNQYTIQLDGRSFDYIWLDYLVQSKTFQVSISKRDADNLTSDVNKQIFINRVNKRISERYTLVTLIIFNYLECFKQLKDFVKYLPYNFKIIFVSPVGELEFDFYIKRAEYMESSIEESSSDLLRSICSITDDDLERFIVNNVRSVNEYSDAF